MAVELSVPGDVLRVAEYVRMSTDKQEYSIANQRDFISRYAREHGMQVVRSYADQGRSGLFLKGRDALSALIRDVHDVHRDFGAVLVYDVSRWGRFQDTDEGAHYEFICKQAGVKVIYCAELFDDTTPMSSLVKAIKRAMAAEFSREHGQKILDSQLRTARLGFHAAGPGSYGYRRTVFDQSGKMLRTLGRRESKYLKSDRVRLMLGPRNEVDAVRRMFRMAARGVTPLSIARAMNKRGVKACRGLPWTEHAVRHILKREVYVGRAYFNRESSRLGSPAIRNPESLWVSQSVQPIISEEVFRATQQHLASRRHKDYSDEQMFSALRRIANRHRGRVTDEMVKRSKDAPSLSAYHKRYGSTPILYHRLGFEVDEVRLERALDDARAHLLTSALNAAVRTALARAGFQYSYCRNVRNRLLVRGMRVSITYKRVGRDGRPMPLQIATKGIDIALLARASLHGDHFLEFYLFDLRVGLRWRFEKRDDAIEGALERCRGNWLAEGQPIGGDGSPVLTAYRLGTGVPAKSRYV